MVSGLRYRSFPRILSSLFLFCSFFIIYLPIAVLVAFSFNSRAFPAPWDHFTFDWYKKLFAYAELWESFWNSLVVASSSTLLCLLLSTCLLYLLSKKSYITRWLPLFYGNIVIPETVLAVGLLSYFSLLNIPLGLHTIIVGHTVIGLGFAIPILFVRFQDLDRRIFEASKVLGATSLQTFFRITLPLMRPTLMTTALMIFIISFDDFILAYFCSGATAQTLSLFLVASIRYSVSPSINALASILLLLTTLLTVIFFSLKQRARVF